MSQARILLADDHQKMRERVVHLLEREFEILAALENGQAILEAASDLNPDVCILDISMPTLNGIDAAIQLKKRGSTAKIIFLTVDEDVDFMQAALKTGASGYVIKRRIGSDLRIAVREVLAGRTFISSSLTPHDENQPK